MIPGPPGAYSASDPALKTTSRAATTFRKRVVGTHPAVAADDGPDPEGANDDVHRQQPLTEHPRLGERDPRMAEGEEQDQQPGGQQSGLQPVAQEESGENQGDDGTDNGHGQRDPQRIDGHHLDRVLGEQEQDEEGSDQRGVGRDGEAIREARTAFSAYHAGGTVPEGLSNHMIVFGYIDPGTGSLLIQALIAAIVAIPFFFRRSIGAFVTRIRGKGSAEPPAAIPAETDSAEDRQP